MQIKQIEGSSDLPCHFCKKNALQKFFVVKEAPAFLGCTNEASFKDVFISFEVFICKYCGLIQTNADTAETTYSELHSEALGATWEKHHQSFAQFIQDRSASFNQPISILEIGVSAQPIARSLSLPKKNVFYIDPIKNPPFLLQEEERYFSGFFPEVSPNQKVDIIIASHVLEHVPKTADFLESVYRHLSPAGLFFISIPDFETWLNHFYFNAISAEHITYPFASQLKNLAFPCFDIELSLYKEHSVFASFSPKVRRQKDHPFSKGLFSHNASILTQWVQVFNQRVNISKLPPNDNPLFITGASHLSQYLLLSNKKLLSRVTGVLDNSKRKWGQRLYGTAVKACSFEELKVYPQPFVYLTPSPYSEEMRRQIEALNPNTNIIDLNYEN